MNILASNKNFKILLKFGYFFEVIDNKLTLFNAEEKVILNNVYRFNFICVKERYFLLLNYNGKDLGKTFYIYEIAENEFHYILQVHIKEAGILDNFFVGLKLEEEDIIIDFVDLEIKEFPPKIELDEKYLSSCVSYIKKESNLPFELFILGAYYDFYVTKNAYCMIKI